MGRKGRKPGGGKAKSIRADREMREDMDAVAANETNGPQQAESFAPQWAPYVDRVASSTAESKLKQVRAPKRRWSARILVADDDEAVAQLMATALREAGLVCDVAIGGREAVARIEQQTYDVVVVDLMMPDVGGMEVVRAVRQRGGATRVIVVTGHGDVDTAVEALRSRVDDYISKPIDVETFLASVERSVGRQKTLRDIRLTHRHLAQELAELNLKLQRRFTGGVVSLAAALEARDPYTKGHSSRVATMCIGLGRALDIHGERLDNLVVGALLHDIGKIAVPDAVLLKPGKLSRDEFAKIQDHPRGGYDILFPFFGRSTIIDCALSHHERWDGNGYPRGLKGEQCPLVGRIIALCDAYDAMTSARPYRPPLPESHALNEIEANRDRQFDPRLADLFLKTRPYQASQRDPEASN